MRVHVKSRRTSVVAAMLGVAMATAACGGDDAAGGGGGEGEAAGPVTLDFYWWGNDDRAERYNQAIALFEEANPDIDVNANFQDWEGYWTSRSTEAASRSLPDVLQMDLSYLAEYSQNSHLLDLTPYIGEQIDVSGYSEAVLEAGQLGGEQVGIPTGTNSLALFVNPVLAEQAGVEAPAEGYTWEDYNAWALGASQAGATNADGQPVYGTADYTGTFWVFMQWLVQQGIEPFAEDGSFNFTEDDVREFLELGAPLREAGAIFPPDRATQIAPLSGFGNNEVVGEFSWDNFLAGYVADSGTEDLVMAPVPSAPDGTVGMFAKPAMMLSAGASTEHPEEAAQLIDFLLTDPEVGQIFGTSKGVPADEGQREALELEEGSIDAQVVAYEESVADLITEPVPTPILGFGAIEGTWLRLAEELQYGGITVDEFVERWFAEAETATS